MLRAKIIKPLEENIHVSFHDLGSGSVFLYMIPKTQATTMKKILGLIR